jgi:ribosome-binding factor A
MSPLPRRMERIDSQMQAEIADIIRTEMKDPRIGFVSITRVETSSDLRHARVRVSVLGTPEEKESTMAGLGRAAGFVREILLRRLRLRRVPQLEFILDENIEYSIHIADVMSKLNTPPPDEEGDPS